MVVSANRQRGFVSILTVLFFMTLISVITVSFTRFMIQERRQELEDELTKSAYNAALAGIEDAKQAMAYCASPWLSDSDRTNCENNLYASSCPGFNATDYFQNNLGGIPKSDNGKTTVTGESTSSAAQGYSCVIVTKDTPSIENDLTANTASGDMYELRTTGSAQSYRTIRIYWQSTGQATGGSAANFNSGNPRQPDWDGRLPNSPAVLRLSLISVAEPIRLSSITQQTTFIYPTQTGTTTFVNASGIAPRVSTQCDTSTSIRENYRCYIDIRFAHPGQWHNQYIVLNTLYRDAGYKVVAFSEESPGSNATPLKFGGVQPTIDSTGYTSGISRRVVARVTTGGQSINTGNAIDTSTGFCKNFRVSATASVFLDEARAACTP